MDNKEKKKVLCLFTYRMHIYIFAQISKIYLHTEKNKGGFIPLYPSPFTSDQTVASLGWSDGLVFKPAGFKLST